jgi:GDP/UDP-N,N'-diacetylbacillosamine 2-epimerase (hydrolysing)
MERRICYISGTRADFGLMRSTLVRIAASPGLSLSVIATGMHLDRAYGLTVDEIRRSGLAISAEIPVPVEPATGGAMARNIATMLSAIVDAMEADRPDMVLLLGDRGEMLAGALAAIHLNIPVVHIHGGERSGTVDEPIRHAISKLAHIHLVATAGARERLVRMGEDAAHIHVTGAPGLDGLRDLPLPEQAGTGRSTALMVFHPVLQEAGSAESVTEMILDALDRAGCDVLALKPNADAGSDGVRRALDAVRGREGLTIAVHLERPEFIAKMASVDLMIGTSSAGIIEAASFGTPVINVGSRQNLRERNANVRDVPAEPGAISMAIKAALSSGRLPVENVYGDGHAGERIVQVLRTADLSPALMQKVNGY